MSDMLGITYSCGRCGLKDAEVKVRYRESSEDVLVWMKQVVEPALLEDHFQHSPHCKTDHVDDVKIPIPEGSEFIGGPAMH